MTRATAPQVGSPEHWRDAASYPDKWAARAKLAAGWIQPSQSVIDIGCGARLALKALLPDGCTYAGADLQPWTDEVQQVDLNAGGFPDGTHDVAVMLGVVEYLIRPSEIFLKARRRAQTLIVSYCHPKPFFDRAERARRGWINALREKRFAEVLTRCGWRIEASEVYSESGQFRQVVYKTRAIEAAPRAGLDAGPEGTAAHRVWSERLTYLRPEKLSRLEKSLADVLQAGAAGDVAEFGVALGGSGIVLAGPALAHERRFFGFDVFGMIPPPRSEKDGPDTLSRYEQIAAGRSKGIQGDTYYGYRPDLYADVCAAFGRFRLTVDGRRISLVKGLFQHTVPTSDLGPLCFAHIDCDWYDPVRYCLAQVAGRLSPGGLVVIDDYHAWSGCRVATDEFLADNPDFVMDDGPSVIVRRRA